MQRLWILPTVNAAILVIGFLGIVLFDSSGLILAIIVVGFIAAAIATIEGVLRYRGQSKLPLWYVLAGLITAGGFFSWLFAAMGEVNFIGLIIPLVGVIGLFVAADRMRQAGLGSEPAAAEAVAPRTDDEPAAVD